MALNDRKCSAHFLALFQELPQGGCAVPVEFFYGLALSLLSPLNVKSKRSLIHSVGSSENQV
jgi:hypothetical protein